MTTKTGDKGSARLMVRFYDENDENALAEFFLQFKDLAFKIAFNVLNNSADAEDITQQTFVQILKKQAICKAAYDGDDYKVKSWLLAIIYNASRMQYNAKKKNKTYELKEGVDVESPKNQEADASSEKDNILSKLNSAIFDLPEKYRVPILMRYHQDMSIDDISKTLASQPGTIRSILSRGVSILRNKLSNEKVMLSSTAAIEMISNIPFPMPHQEISLSLIKSIKASNPHVTSAVKASQASKISLFLKSAVAVSVFATITTGYFVMNKKEITSEPEKAPISQRIPLLKAETNVVKTIWDFTKETGSDITNIQGSFSFDPQSNAIIDTHKKDGVATSAIIKLPYQLMAPTKITATSKAAPNRTQFSAPMFNSFEFIPVFNDKPIPGGMLFHNKLNMGSPYSDKFKAFQFDHIFYLFENVCVTTTMEGKILKIHRFDNLKENSNIGFIVANFSIEKIKVEKLEKTEHEKILSQSLEILNKNKKDLDPK